MVVIFFYKSNVSVDFAYLRSIKNEWDMILQKHTHIHISYIHTLNTVLTLASYFSQMRSFNVIPS